MKAPEPIPRVPMENFRSRSMRELRFASRMAFTLFLALVKDTTKKGKGKVHFFCVTDIGDQIPRLLNDLIAEFMV